MDQSTSKWNLLTCVIALILVLSFVSSGVCSTASKTSGGGVFDAPEVVEHEGEETVTLDFASVGVEKANWGYGQVVDGKFKVFVRDKNVTKTWRFGLPRRLSVKSNWEVALQVNQFDFNYLGVGVGGLHAFPKAKWDPVITVACLLIPVNGGKCSIRHVRPGGFEWGRDNRERTYYYEAGQSIQKIALPATIKFVYDGMEQQYTVYANDKEIATYCFATFENRIPWNITHIEPVILTPDRSPVKMELGSKFTVRAW